MIPLLPSSFFSALPWTFHLPLPSQALKLYPLWFRICHQSPQTHIYYQNVSSKCLFQPSCSYWNWLDPMPFHLQHPRYRLVLLLYSMTHIAWDLGLGWESPLLLIDASKMSFLLSSSKLNLVCVIKFYYLLLFFALWLTDLLVTLPP